MRRITDDLSYGKQSEDEVIEDLNREFGDIFRHTKEIYGKGNYNYDFEGSLGLKIELKTRRNTKDKYETTIIPKHKTECGDKSPDVYVFRFTDGLYYVRYDRELFDSYEVKDVVYRRIGRIDKKPHYHIRVSDLIRFGS